MNTLPRLVCVCIILFSSGCQIYNPRNILGGLAEAFSPAEYSQGQNFGQPSTYVPNRYERDPVYTGDARSQALQYERDARLHRERIANNEGSSSYGGGGTTINLTREYRGLDGMWYSSQSERDAADSEYRAEMRSAQREADLNAAEQARRRAEQDERNRQARERELEYIRRNSGSGGAARE